MNLVTVERDIWTTGGFGKKKLMRTTTSSHVAPKLGQLLLKIKKKRIKVIYVND